MKFKKANFKICVIGLGYVGLPLALALSKHFKVIGFDLNKKRINDLKSNIDQTCEVSSKELENAINLSLTSSSQEIKASNVFIVTVPTPITKTNVPDLRAIKHASQMLGKNLMKGSLVIYESTVYPGVTEDIAAPILEKYSKLKLNKDFGLGYSPERINPGDKKHSISNIKKVISASNTHYLKITEFIYSSIIKAGLHLAPSIKVAEAAKVIENTQRDLNIALINELSIIFSKLKIDTFDVLEAASTKWNFLPFQPGLVGGHCIGVDPYYLTFKSIEEGYYPEVVLSGRKVNDDYPVFLAKKILKTIKQAKRRYSESNVLVCGVTFKENCPDIRNTKVINLVKTLQKSKVSVDIFDPIASKSDVLLEYNVKLKQNFSGKYDVVVFAVAHSQFKKLTKLEIDKLLRKHGKILDLKNIFPNNSKRITL